MLFRLSTPVPESDLYGTSAEDLFQVRPIRFLIIETEATCREMDARYEANAGSFEVESPDAVLPPWHP
jgi:hypothetical protein